MNNPMFQNPVMQMINTMRGGGNPMRILQQMAGRNPQMGQFVQMVGGKGPQQLKQMAMNAARERGVSVEQVAQSLGISLPSGD